MNLFSYAALLLRGTWITLASWAFAGILSMLVGTLLGILGCKHFMSGRFAILVKCYTFIAKGIPAYVQILIVYFVIPSLLNIQVSGFVAASSALAFCSSGYVAEIVRAGMNAISQGQWDACYVLGYPLYPTLTRIMLPQAFRMILPAVCGELEQLLKSTSLLATIGVIELTRTGMNIISRELNPLSVYSMLACIYLLLSAFLQIGAWYVERRFNYDYR